MHILLPTLVALGSPVDAATLTDVGVARSHTPALVVVTPGVDASAYEDWVEVLERRGLDVWLLVFSADDLPGHAPHAIAEAASELEARGPLKVAAHGLGGVLVLAAGIAPERLALVGTPLGPHAVSPVFPEPTGTQGLGWPVEWTGAVASVPVHPAMQRDYRAWSGALPAYEAPACPTLLIGSNVDVVAPPETMRLPSQAWSDRTWERAGYLSMEDADPLHAELLSRPRVAKRVARFLAEGS